MSRLNVKRDAGEFSAAKAGIGYDFGVLRRQGERPDDGWQLSVFGSIDSLFNLDLPGDALVNTDYRIGLPLTWRAGHLLGAGAHVPPELAPRRRADPRRQRAAAHRPQLRDGRLAGGVGVRAAGASMAAANYVWRSSTDAYDKGGGAHLGFDFVGSSGVIFGMRLTGGVDVKWLEQADWRSGTSVEARPRWSAATRPTGAASPSSSRPTTASRRSASSSSRT